MSWGINNPCYSDCPIFTTCEDRIPMVVGITNTVFGIHMNPKHSSEGGYGSIIIDCQKKQNLLKEVVKNEAIPSENQKS